MDCPVSADLWYPFLKEAVFIGLNDYIPDDLQTLGQGFSLHLCVPVAAPVLQGPPLQDLVLERLPPPHVRSHALHDPQGCQLPSKSKSSRMLFKSNTISDY